MNALVEIRHNEPMTTSEILAVGVDLQHKNVVSLIRGHVGHLADFGEVAFQTRLNPQGSPTEFAWLNEGQSLFLLTLMRNSPVVIEFKKALIRAFLELRDRVAAAVVPDRAEPLTLSHRADVQVAAGRIFRDAMRSGRALGLSTAHTVRRAQALTLTKTGVDVLADMDAEDRAAEPGPGGLPPDEWGARAFLAAWLAGELPVPVTVCRGSDLYMAYCCWCHVSGREPAGIHRFFCFRRTVEGLEKIITDILQPETGTRLGMRVVVPPGARRGVPLRGWHRAAGDGVARFAAALAAWHRDTLSDRLENRHD